jgi:uncharacterized membrane protein
MASRSGPGPAPTDDLDRTIARLLTVGTYVSIALLALGVGLMAAAGLSPLDGGPDFDPSRLAADLAALRPEGFLWLGLIAAIATPSARVAASFVGYLRRGERAMAGVSVLILGVIALSVLLATVTEG